MGILTNGVDKMRIRSYRIRHAVERVEQPKNLKNGKKSTAPVSPKPVVLSLPIPQDLRDILDRDLARKQEIEATRLARATR
jgi:hypothetical protein